MQSEVKAFSILLFFIQMASSRIRLEHSIGNWNGDVPAAAQPPTMEVLEMYTQQCKISLDLAREEMYIRYCLWHDIWHGLVLLRIPSKGQRPTSYTSLQNHIRRRRKSTKESI